MVVSKKAKLRDAQNQVRDILNWLAVFEEEYHLPEEVTSTMQKSLMSLSQKINKL